MTKNKCPICGKEVNGNIHVACALYIIGELSLEERNKILKQELQFYDKT